MSGCALVLCVIVVVVVTGVYDVTVARVTDDEYSDDDDMSWKVRRAAAKCLDAIVSTRHEMLSHLYASVSLALIARFKGQCLASRPDGGRRVNLRRFSRVEKPVFGFWVDTKQTLKLYLELSEFFYKSVCVSV